MSPGEAGRSKEYGEAGRSRESDEARRSAEDAEFARLLDRFRRRDRRALARLLTWVDDGRLRTPLLDKLRPIKGSGLKVGLTGPGGAGKSTLTGALLRYLRGLEKSVAVLACDPASPFTGGALLGDRVRMDYDPDDEKAFMRSVSSRGAGGGISDSAAAMIRVLDAFGFDVVLIETVGAGQDQLAVREIVDVLVLLLTPAAGDDIQWEKAGLLEAADIVVVNKGDLPGADQALAGLRLMLDIGAHQAGAIPVLRTVASTGEGIAELWTAIESQSRPGVVHRQARARRRLLEETQRLLSERFTQNERDNRVAELIRLVDTGALSVAQAAQSLLDHLLSVR